MAEGFDPAAYLDAQYAPQQQQPEPEAEEFKPRLTTFYYPQTPEQTRAAGLSYRMEGGTQGGGKFGDIDLRQHTLEQYQAGESPWVAIAMPGTPTGKIYNIPYEGGYIKGRNVDTGGGLRPGQVDIATSNPELARGYAKRDEYVSAEPSVSTEIPTSRLPGVSESDIDRLLGKTEKKEEPKRTAKAQPAPSAPRPIPRVDVNIPQMPMAEIGLPDLTAPGMSGGIGQPIPPPQIPQFPMAEAQPLPMPTPDFGIGVQEAIEQVPQSALLAGPPTAAAVAGFDPAAYLARQQQAPPPTPTPSPPQPTATPSGFDPTAYLSQQAQPTQTITPAPTQVAFDPAAYLASQTSGQELPPTDYGTLYGGPSGEELTAIGRGQAPVTERPRTFGTEFEKGLVENVKAIVPTSWEGARQLGTIMAAPSQRGEIARMIAQGGLESAVIAKEAIESGDITSPESGRAFGTLGPQYFMQVLGIRASAPRTRKVPPIQEKILPTAPSKKVQSVTDIPEEYLREAEGEKPVKENPIKSAPVWANEEIILNRVIGERAGTDLTLAKSRAHQIAAGVESDLAELGWNKLKKHEQAQLDAVRAGEPVVVTRRVQKIVDYLRNYFERTADEYERLGATVEERPIYRDPQTGQTLRDSIRRPFERLANYWPRKIDQNKVAIVAREPVTPAPPYAPGVELTPFQRDMQALNPGLSPTDIKQVVSGMRAQALGLPDPVGITPDNLRLIKGDPYKPGHLHARTNLNYPEYIYRSVYETVPEYIQMSSRERGFLEVFGPEADAGIEARISELGINNHDVKLASEVWDKFRGRYIDPESQVRVKKTGHILGNIAGATLLGPQTMALQPSQFSALTGKFATRNMAKAFGRMIVNPKTALVEARRAGSFMNSILNELAVQSRIDPKTTGWSKAEILTAKLASEVYKWTGIKGMDKFPRAIGYWAAKYALQDAQRAALNGNKKAQRLLKEAGIDVASDDMAVARGAGTLSRKYNISTDSMPWFLENTSVGAFSRSLQSFNIQVSRLMWNDFLKPAMKGNVAPLVRLLASGVVIGEGIGQVRDWLTGRRTRPGGPLPEFLDDVIHGRATKMQIAKRALDDLSWSGTMGYVQSIYQAFQYAQSGTEMGARLMSTIAGAGLSNLGEIAAGGAELAIGGVQAMFADTDDEKSRQRYESHLRTGGRILTRRIPALGGIIAPRAFPSAAADRRVAIEGMKRARKRGDAQRYSQWEDWFMRRHPDRRISEKALEGD